MSDIEVSSFVKHIIRSSRELVYSKYTSSSIQHKLVVLTTLFVKACSDIYDSKLSPEISQWELIKEYLNNNLKNSISGVSVDKRSSIYLKDVQFLFDQALTFFTESGIVNSIDVRDLTIGFDEITYQYFILFLDFERIKIKSIEDYELIFEEFISQYAIIEGKYQGSNLTPSSINQLLVKLSGRVNSVLDLTSGYAGILHKSLLKPNVKAYGVEINYDVFLISKLRLAFRSSIELKHADSIRDIPFSNLKVDSVVMVPPFSLKWNERVQRDLFQYGLPPKSNFNLGWIQLALNYLNQNGKAFVVLSKNSSLSLGKEKVIRENLIKSNLIEAVISLPENIYHHTSILSDIWILNKSKTTKDILFIDASHFFERDFKKSQRRISHQGIDEIVTIYSNWSSKQELTKSKSSIIVTINEVINQNYSLNKGYYIDVLEGYSFKNKVSLSELLTPIDRTTQIDIENLPALSVKNLKDSSDSFNLSTDELEINQKLSGHRTYKGNGLLVSLVGEKLKPTYFDTKGAAVAIIPHVAFWNINSKVHIGYLIQELRKDYVNIQLDQIRTGAAMRRFRKADFLKIFIDLPSSELQEKSFEKGKNLRFEKLAMKLGFKEQLENLKLEQEQDLGSKKHNINQHLNNVKASADTLKLVMFQKEHNISIHDIVNPKKNISIKHRFELMLESLDKVIFYADNLTNDLVFDKLKPVKIIPLLKKLKRQDSSRLYTIEIDVDEAIENPDLKISERDFEELFNNIVENAVKHGFIDSSLNYVLRIALEDRNDKVLIRFENNGKPFPKGMKDQFGIKGAKAGTTANTGIGTWRIVQIAKHFNAEYNVIDNPEAIFPVGIELLFNKEEDEI